MKRYLSIILSLCTILSAGSFYVFAQDESTEKTIDKVEASLMTMEVYCDLSSPECIYFFNITPIHCSYNLQKIIDGEWQTLRNYGAEDSDPIGTGLFRFVFGCGVYHNIENEYYKIEPGVTRFYIDGVDCGAVDENYRAYSQTFELTEADKVPEPQFIDEVRIEGFKTPAAGEYRQYQDELTVICKGAEDAYTCLYYTAYETNQLGETDPGFEIHSGGCRYTCRFAIDLHAYKYAFSDDVRLYLGDEELDLNTKDSFIRRNHVETRVNYMVSNLPGGLGETENFFSYLFIATNVILSRTFFWAGDLISDVFYGFSNTLNYYLEQYARNIEYYLGLDELDRMFFFV